MQVWYCNDTEIIGETYYKKRTTSQSIEENGGTEVVPL